MGWTLGFLPINPNTAQLLNGLKLYIQTPPTSTPKCEQI